MTGGPNHHLTQNTAPGVSAQCAQIINILARLYFVEKELESMGLEIASTFIEATSRSLKEEINKLPQ